MIRQSSHFTSRIYNRRFEGQVFAIIDSYLPETGNDHSVIVQIEDDEPILTRDELEREGFQFTGERDYIAEDYYQARAEEQYQGYDERREPERYGWDQYGYRGNF